ncbi:uncharacterized protein L969DRAFT_87195 [Mixia osmundae IAM 14324]|uniref:uncharacterized protein n=1 Tax=Mixia osmundae (strain CBS 9802 / IAM 14324 / JCM 22182 / KY 12970) TaxID=764103 RepID=UPI0004A54D59|nr:uncharacterized protein L969DRAFT_87195 [Mixia osmundae IAM 14324]KEI39253.1 hypothetical protein L969DRAFT_87195 [Mixia osmundae IAM 14324]
MAVLRCVARCRSQGSLYPSVLLLCVSFSKTEMRASKKNRDSCDEDFSYDLDLLDAEIEMIIKEHDALVEAVNALRDRLARQKWGDPLACVCDRSRSLATIRACPSCSRRFKKLAALKQRKVAKT